MEKHNHFGPTWLEVRITQLQAENARLKAQVQALQRERDDAERMKNMIVDNFLEAFPDDPDGVYDGNGFGWTVEEMRAKAAAWLSGRKDAGLVSIVDVWCPLCVMATKQEERSSGHERDSSGDTRKCLRCGGHGSGLDGFRVYLPETKDGGT